jgi:hypothetical protein
MNGCPPPVRALIGRSDVPKRGTVTRLVLITEVPYWEGLGWTFIATDPEDEFQFVYWAETQGRKR